MLKTQLNSFMIDNIKQRDKRAVLRYFVYNPYF